MSTKTSIDIVGIDLAISRHTSSGQRWGVLDGVYITNINFKALATTEGGAEFEIPTFKLSNI